MSKTISVPPLQSLAFRVALPIFVNAEHMKDHPWEGEVLTCDYCQEPRIYCPCSLQFDEMMVKIIEKEWGDRLEQSSNQCCGQNYCDICKRFYSNPCNKHV
jgi:CO dehydrogenase/acetyl-CoA synthase alpha subunit